MRKMLLQHRVLVCCIAIEMIVAIVPARGAGETLCAESLRPKTQASAVYPVKEGFIDVQGLFLYIRIFKDRSW
jgi:hypothetical protein